MNGSAVWWSGLLVLATAGVATVFPGGALANPVPGMEVSDESSSCTAGFAAQGSDGAYYLLTSGHCDAGDGSQWSGPGETPLGRIFATDYNGDDRDAAIIRLDPSAGVPSGTIDGRYHIRDVLAADQIRLGMPFCKVAATTGETCGAVTGVSDNVVETNLYSQGGDSGGPGFVMNPDGTVSAVGILTASPEDNDFITYFVLVDPLLRQWGLRILH